MFCLLYFYNISFSVGLFYGILSNHSQHSSAASSPKLQDHMQYKSLYGILSKWFEPRSISSWYKLSG